MTDPSADFTSSKGDQEAPIKERIDRLFAALNVLMQHADDEVKGVSIKHCFDVLAPRALPLPPLIMNHKTGGLEYVEPGASKAQALYQKTLANEEIQARYAYGISQADAFSDILIPELIKSYSAHQQLVAALETIRGNIGHEWEIRDYFRENYSPDHAKILRNKFEKGCLGKDSGFMAGMHNNNI